jgi:aspartate ammonia-lyase
VSGGEGGAGFRTERDALGERSIPAGALWGIHTARAMENFPLGRRPVRPELIAAYGQVKLAAVRTNHELGHLTDEIARALGQACEELAEGAWLGEIRVDALQGGAGTSTNMNVNEVLANRALQILGHGPGRYDLVDPYEHANRHQSTNDTFPTALRVAAIAGLRTLERAVVALQESFQDREKAFAHVVKIGRTQMQDAVLTTLGREMGAYGEALARDRWRIYKCEERLRVVNLGGTAIGTGLGAPRRYVFRVVEHLRAITGFGLARAENLVEATQNADAFVEVSGILKACATNLAKIAADLRLLSSGPGGGFGEIRLPARQAGSSIMPGKVNPVIPEAVTQAALRVMAHDQAIAQAASLGALELNAFLPLVADALLESLALLADACTIFRSHCVEGIEADTERCRKQVETSTALATALLPALGYAGAERVAGLAADSGRTVRQVVLAEGLLDEAAFDALTTPEAICRLGHPEPGPPGPRQEGEA